MSRRKRRRRKFNGIDVDLDIAVDAEEHEQVVALRHVLVQVGHEENAAGLQRSDTLERKKTTPFFCAPVLCSTFFS